MIFQKNGNAMAAHRLFWQRTTALRHQVAVFQSNGLLIKAGVADHGRGDLRLIGVDDAHAVFGQVLITEMERVAVDDALDHRRIQETQSFGRTGNLVSHADGPTRNEALPELSTHAPSVKRHAESVKNGAILDIASIQRQRAGIPSLLTGVSQT